MNITMWDMKNKEWINIKNINYIVQLGKYTFKLDGVEYDTDRYELNFIHSEGKT